MHVGGRFPRQGGAVTVIVSSLMHAYNNRRNARWWMNSKVAPSTFQKCNTCRIFSQFFCCIVGWVWFANSIRLSQDETPTPSGLIDRYWYSVTEHTSKAFMLSGVGRTEVCGYNDDVTHFRGVPPLRTPTFSDTLGSFSHFVSHLTLSLSLPSSLSPGQTCGARMFSQQAILSPDYLL